MSTFKSIRCSRQEIAGVLTATCTGLPGKRKRHHSPTGYEWGYGGSGPADLALNILARVRPHNGLRNGVVLLHDGTCVSDAAWACHQQFKWTVIASMPRYGFTLSREDVERWLYAYGAGRQTVGRELIEREETHALAHSACLDGPIAAADSQRDLDAPWAGMHSDDCLCDACERVRLAYTGENG